jgi:DNA polymerase-3 subunit gamma/tau
MLTKEASNALLKTLEEPPPHVIFILATTEAHKLLATILSRCQRFDFHRLSQTDVVDKLASICETEGIQIEKEALKLVAKAATGSLRDAENLLQQLNTYYGTSIELQQVQSLLGISGDQRAGELAKDIVNQDVAAGIATINNVNNDGLDLRQFNRDVVEYLRRLLLVKTGSSEAIELTADDLKELKELADQAPLPRILKAVKLFGQLDLGLDNYATLPLELALIDSAAATPEETAKNDRPEPSQPPRTAAPKAAAPKEPATNPQPAKAAEPEPPRSTTSTEDTEESSPLPPPAPEANGDNEPEPASTENSGVSPLSSEIEQLQINWRKFIMEAPGGIGRTPAAALLRSATPIAIEDNTLVISFKYPLHKENMEKIENQKTAEKIVSGFLGRSCQVRCVYEPENNHLVKAALRMGAKVIDTEEP